MSKDNKEKSAQAAKLVRRHAIGAIAASILPVPLLDIGILGGIHLRMLSRLAEIYDVEFSEQRANAIIGSLLGISAAAAAGGLLRFVPGAGRALFSFGTLTLLPASTYALGQVFIKHFESGGTFLTFDPERARDDYNEELAEGKRSLHQHFAGVKP